MPFSGAVKDLCGVCQGINSCVDCSGVPNGGKTVDFCGVCGGNNTCLGCDLIPFSNATVDRCGMSFNEVVGYTREETYACA